MDNRQTGIKDLEIIIRARTLQDWVFRVTSKKPKKPMNEFEDGENNGLPAKYQHSVGTRMQNYTIDILEFLQTARFDKADRANQLNAVIRTTVRLNECIWLCFRLRIIRKASAEEGERLLLEVKRMAIAWRNKSV